MAPQVMLARRGELLLMAGRVDDDPTCMQMTISLSCAAAITGSQYPEGSWMVGRPSGSGFSENANDLAPLAAHRSSSLAAAWGSHSGVMTSGMKRPGADAHHSSIIQSL